MPNTCVIPKATNVSTSTSATVRTRGAGAGMRTSTPSARSATSYGAAAYEVDALRRPSQARRRAPAST